MESQRREDDKAARHAADGSESLQSGVSRSEQSRVEAARGEDGASELWRPNMALRVVTLPFVIVFLSAHALITVTLIDTFLALATLIMSRLGSGARVRLRWIQAKALEVWMTPLIGFLEHFGGLTMRVHGEKFVEGESAIVVVNHRSWVDSVALYCISRQVNAHGALKFFAKKSLMLFPIYGVAGHVLNACVFITRSASRATRRLRSEFAHLTELALEQHLAIKPPQFWMISYLEGTRRTSKKVQEAREFALERGLKPLTHVLQPRVKGFVAMATELRPAAHAVYDITLGYAHARNDEDNPQPAFTSILFDYCCGRERVLHVYQRRIPMAEVPEDEAALREFVYALYQKKDELLEQFETKREFPQPKLEWTRISLQTTAVCFFAMGAATALSIILASKVASGIGALMSSASSGFSQGYSSPEL